MSWLPEGNILHGDWDKSSFEDECVLADINGNPVKSKRMSDYEETITGWTDDGKPIVKKVLSNQAEWIQRDKERADFEAKQEMARMNSRSLAEKLEIDKRPFYRLKYKDDSCKEAYKSWSQSYDENAMFKDLYALKKPHHIFADPKAFVNSKGDPEIFIITLEESPDTKTPILHVDYYIPGVTVPYYNEKDLVKPAGT